MPTTPKRRYRPKITYRGRNLVKNLAKGMPQKQAAIQAGYSPKNASQSAYQALSRIQGSLAEIMDQRGLYRPWSDY
jgi:phage terminase small subunit